MRRCVGCCTLPAGTVTRPRNAHHATQHAVHASPAGGGSPAGCGMRCPRECRGSGCRELRVCANADGAGRAAQARACWRWPQPGVAGRHARHHASAPGCADLGECGCVLAAVGVAVGHHASHALPASLAWKGRGTPIPVPSGPATCTRCRPSLLCTPIADLCVVLRRRRAPRAQLAP